jgi:hypothetical protein
MKTFENINDTLTELIKFPFLQLWYLFNIREDESGKSRIVISLITVFLLAFGFALTFVHLLVGSLCFAIASAAFGSLGQWHSLGPNFKENHENGVASNVINVDQKSILQGYQDRKNVRFWVGLLLSIALSLGTYYAISVGGWVGFLGWGLIPSLLVVSVGSFIINALADKLDIDAIKEAIIKKKIEQYQSSSNKQAAGAIALVNLNEQEGEQAINLNNKSISYQDLNITYNANRFILCGLGLLGVLAIAPLLLAEMMWLMPLYVAIPLSVMVSQLMKTEQANPNKHSRLLQVWLQAGLLSGAMYLAAPLALVSPMTLVLWGSAVIALHAYLSFHSENIWSFLPWALAFSLPLFLPMSSAVCLASGLFSLGVWLDQRPWNSKPDSKNTLFPIGFIMFFSPVMMFTLVNVFPVLLAGQWGICAYLLAVGIPFIGSWWREYTSSSEEQDLSRYFLLTYMPLTFSLWFVHPLAFYILFGSGLMMIFKLEPQWDAHLFRMLWSLCFTSVWGLSLWLGGASSLYWLWLIVPILIVGLSLKFETGQQKTLIGLAMLTLALALAPGMPISIALGFSQLSAGWMFLHGVICFMAGGLSLAMIRRQWSESPDDKEIQIVEFMIALMALPMGIYLGAMPGWGVSLVFSTLYFWLVGSMEENKESANEPNFWLVGSMEENKESANEPSQIFNQFLTIGATSALFAGWMWLWPITNMWALIGLGIGLAIFNSLILVGWKFQDSHSASISYLLFAGLVLSILFPVPISCTMICGLLLPNVLVEGYAEWQSSRDEDDQEKQYNAKSWLAKVLMTALAIAVPIAIAPGTELSMLLGLSTQWYIGIMIAMGVLGFAVQLATEEDKVSLHKQQENKQTFEFTKNQNANIDFSAPGTSASLRNNLGAGQSHNSKNN